MTSSSSRSRDVMRSSNYASYLVERPPKAVAKVTACVVCTCRGSFRWKMNGSNRKLYVMNNVRHGLSGMFIFISDVNQSSSGNEFL